MLRVSLIPNSVLPVRKYYLPSLIISKICISFIKSFFKIENYSNETNQWIEINLVDKTL